jgi:AcrR family transcriptional regulator
MDKFDRDAMTESPQKYRPTDDRKRAIAAAARSLIVEKGFEGLRTREIAERVGINIATLHYHIPSKDALIQLVAQSMQDDFMSQHARQPRDGLPPLEQLKIEINQHRETRRENPELLLVMEEMGRRARHDESIARYITPMRAYWHRQIAEILEAGVADGTFRADLDSHSAAYMVIGLLIAGSIFRLDDRQSMDRPVAELLRALLSDKTKAQSNV